MSTLSQTTLAYLSILYQVILGLTKFYFNKSLLVDGDNSTSQEVDQYNYSIVDKWLLYLLELVVNFFRKIFANTGVRLKIKLNQLLHLPVQLIIKSLTII